MTLKGMEKKIDPLDLCRVTLTSLKQKRHKVARFRFASTWKRGGSLSDFLNSLPEILVERI